MQALRSNAFVDETVGKNFVLSKLLVEKVEASVATHKKQLSPIYTAACLAFLELPQRRRNELLAAVVAAGIRDNMRDLIFEAIRRGSEEDNEGGGVAGKIPPNPKAPGGIHATPFKRKAAADRHPRTAQEMDDAKDKRG